MRVPPNVQVHPRYNCPRIRTVTCNARLDAKTIRVNMFSGHGATYLLAMYSSIQLLETCNFTVDGNKASKCDFKKKKQKKKISLQKCVCAAFSVLTFVKTWRYFLWLDFWDVRVFTFWRCLVLQVIDPFGIWWMLFFFYFVFYFFVFFCQQQCVCRSRSDRRAARPQRATSGGRWPIHVDLFTMVGLIAWRHSFFFFSPLFFLFLSEHTAH